MWGKLEPRIVCRKCPLEAAFYSSDEEGPPYACEAHRGPHALPLRAVDPPPVCGNCGASEGVQWESSDTAYHTPTIYDQPHSVWRQLLINCGVYYLDPEDAYANCPIAYCRECALEHHAYWNEMWDEYYAGMG